MADVQVENGYTRIANELLDTLCSFRLPGEATLVLNFIIRKTYGYGKKDDDIALSQFVLATKLSKPHVCKALKILSRLGVIVTQKGNGITNYMINKDFDTWDPLPKKVTLPKKVMTVTQKGNNRYPIGDIQKKKENVTKEICAVRKNELAPERQFLTDYGNLFRTRFGTTYICQFAKDTKLVKEMLKAIEYSDLLNRAGQFLRDEDDWLKRKGYTIGMFKSMVNRYVAKKATVVKGYEPERLTQEQEQAAEAAKTEAMQKLREKGILRDKVQG
jgi:phage replication O-like protein O